MALHTLGNHYFISVSDFNTGYKMSLTMRQASEKCPDLEDGELFSWAAHDAFLTLVGA